MDADLQLDILSQPDETTCGPTCLHAVLRYLGDTVPLEEIIRGVPRLSDGGTLAVLLACYALRRGFPATIYTYNLQMFDPCWFDGRPIDLRQKLIAQSQAKHDERLHLATRGYLEFLDLGGKVHYEDLSPRLIRRYLRRRIPILTGLSATYLYRTPREFGPTGREDDVQGLPAGHFVLLCGYDQARRCVKVADPLHPNPLSQTHTYSLAIDRVIGAILLGVLTYDANLLIIEPRRGQKGSQPWSR